MTIKPKQIKIKWLFDKQKVKEKGNEKLYTFSDASRKIGKNRNYFSNRYQLNPEYFDHNMVVVGGVKFLDEDGINAILGKIKKVVVL